MSATMVGLSPAFVGGVFGDVLLEFFVEERFRAQGPAVLFYAPTDNLADAHNFSFGESSDEKAFYQKALPSLEQFRSARIFETGMEGGQKFVAIRFPNRAVLLLYGWSEWSDALVFLLAFAKALGLDAPHEATTALSRAMRDELSPAIRELID